MHQITAYGGRRGPVPFQQAIPQSPGFQPLVSNDQQEQIFNDYLALLNVTTIEEARQLPFKDLVTANTVQVGGANYGSFVFGPAVDGNFVPALPGELLLHGAYDKNIKVMVGHNADEVSCQCFFSMDHLGMTWRDVEPQSSKKSPLFDYIRYAGFQRKHNPYEYRLIGTQGILFTSPFIQNNADFRQSILTDLPTLSGLPRVLRYITNKLYPPIFDGSQAMGYTNQIARAAALTSELYGILIRPLECFYANSKRRVFTCNTFYLDKAYGNNTYAYLFSIPPAIHGEDVMYTYYNGPNSQVATPIAIALQEYLTAFAEMGTPNEAGVPFFPLYGPGAIVQDLNITGISQIMDPAANSRCDWWQRARYV